MRAYTLTVSGSTTLSGSLDSMSSVTATQFFGGGAGITGVTAEWDGTHTGNGNITGILTFGSLTDGSITIADFKDEDNMSSNSATSLPTQQSVKAYVDSQVTAQDLDFKGDDDGALSIDLDSEVLDIAGGTNITTAGSGNVLTVNVDDSFLVNDASDTTSGTITAGGFTTSGTSALTATTVSTLTATGNISGSSSSTGSFGYGYFAGDVKLLTSGTTAELVIDSANYTHVTFNKNTVKKGMIGYDSTSGRMKWVFSSAGMSNNDSGVSLDSSGNFECKQTFIVRGETTLYSNTELVGADLKVYQGDIYPSVNNGADLGTSSKKFASLYVGTVVGNVTGAVTGNADTATTLATARAINGVDFNGSAAITVTAAAGTLTGATLASGVTASSLTSTGTIASFRSTGIDDNADALAITIDSAENVGIGVTPQTDWTTTRTALQFGPRSVVWGESSNNNTLLAHNVYEKQGTGYASMAAASGSFFLMSDGEMNYRTGMGTGANAAITMTNRFVISNNGNIGIGPDGTPDYYLDVQGTFRADGAASFGSTINSGAITSTGLITGTDLTISGTSTTIGTVTSGIWNAGAITSSAGIIGTTAKFTGNTIIGTGTSTTSMLNVLPTGELALTLQRLSTTQNHSVVMLFGVNTTNNREKGAIFFKKTGTGHGTGDFIFALNASDGGAAQVSESDEVLRLSPGGAATLAGNLTVTGNFTINGTTTIISTTNLAVSESLIELSNGATTGVNDAGFVIERGSTGDNAIFVWDESADRFITGTTTATGTSTGNLTIAAAPLQTAALASTTGTFSGNLTATNLEINTTNPQVKWIASEGSTDDFRVYIAGSGLLFQNTTDNFTHMTLTHTGYTKFDGNVGIGTASPEVELTIQGDGTSKEDFIRLEDSSASGKFVIGIDSGNSYGYFSNTTNGTAHFVMKTDGKVGIGTTAPSARLHVDATTTVASAFIIRNAYAAGNATGMDINITGSNSGTNTAGFFYAINGTGNKGVYISGTPAAATNWALYSDSAAQSYFSGNVGIGTTTPPAKLTVQGGDIYHFNANARIVVGNSGSANNYGQIGWRNADACFVIHCDGYDNDVILQPATGKVGIGTYSPDANLNLVATNSMPYKQGDANFDTYSTTTSTFSLVRMRKSHSMTEANGATTGASTYYLGAICFQGNSGSGFVNGVQIEGIQTAAISSGNAPSRLRIRISNTGGLVDALLLSPTEANFINHISSVSLTTGPIVCSTINTGNGVCEIHQMNQGVTTSDSVTFTGITGTTGTFSGAVTGTSGTFSARGTMDGLTIPAGAHTYGSDGALKISNPHGGHERWWVDSNNDSQALFKWYAKTGGGSEFTWINRDSTGGTTFSAGITATTGNFSSNLAVAESSSGGSAIAWADTLVLETSGDTGMTILSGASSDGNILFGDSASNNRGRIQYRHASHNDMMLYTDGSVALTLNSSQNATFSGNVGIGAGTGLPLHVKGTGEIQGKFENPSTSTNQYAYLQLKSNAGSGDDSYLWFDRASGTADALIGMRDGNLVFITNRAGPHTDNERLVIDTSGNASFASDITLSSATGLIHIGNRFRLYADNSNNDAWIGIGSNLDTLKIGDADFATPWLTIESPGLATFAKAVKINGGSHTAGKFGVVASTTAGDGSSGGHFLNESTSGYQGRAVYASSSGVFSIGMGVYAASSGATTNYALYCGGGDVYITNNVGIGTLTPDYKLQVDGDIAPETTNTHDLGSTTKRWANVYAGDLHLKNEVGDWTVEEGEEELFLHNNLTGKKYAIMMREVE